MLRYAARRLLLLPATLLCIALVGFAMVQLLPGDPIAARADIAAARGLSGADIARLRALYGLDLPVFYNGAVADRGAGVRALIEALRDPARRERSLARLRERGTVALPEIVAAVGQPDALDLARTLLRLPPGATASDVENAHRNLRALMDALVDDYLRDPTPARLRSLEAVGTAAVPRLARAMQEERTDADALGRALASLAGFHHAPGEDPRRAFDRWWRERRLEWVDLSGWERALAAVTETRLGRWLGRLVRLDLGESHDGRPVSALLAEALPVTLLLGLLALLAAYGAGIPLGALCAARRGGLLDRASLGATLALLALPAPWVAVGLVSLVAALPVEVFPVQGLASAGAEAWGPLARAADMAWHLVLPVSCLAYGTTALLWRYQRGAVLSALGEPFVQAARAKGLRERVVLFRHALRASLGPALSLLAVEIPWVLSGSVVVETAFDLPGMGLLTWKALAARDYPVLLGAVMVLALVASLASLASDLLAAWADPRLREGRR